MSRGNLHLTDHGGIAKDVMMRLLILHIDKIY